MNKLALPALTTLLMLSIGSAAPGQSSPNGSSSGMPAAAPAGAAATGTTVSGTFKLRLTVNVLSPAIPASTPIHCTLQVGVVGVSTVLPPGTVDGITDSVVTAATRSGSAATCTLVLPYKWTLFGSNDTITVTYLVNATSSTGIGRMLSVFIETISVPPTGTTTTIEAQTGYI